MGQPLLVAPTRASPDNAIGRPCRPVALVRMTAPLVAGKDLGLPYRRLSTGQAQ